MSYRGRSFLILIQSSQEIVPGGGGGGQSADHFEFAAGVVVSFL